MIDERITPSFWLSEFLDSDIAVRLGLDNTPHAMAMANIHNILAPGAQRVRDVLNTPVFVLSGHRSPLVNKAVGGSETSQHMDGLAMDFKSPAYGTPYVIAKYLFLHAQEIRYDQLIHEGRWVHVSFSPKPRGQVLTAHFTGDKTTYTEGLA